MMKWAVILDVVWGIAKTHGAGIKLTVNSNMSQVMAMEAQFVIAGMIWGEGHSSKITSPMGLTLFYSLQFLI